MKRINIKKDRIEVAKILERNLPIKNKNVCQDVADAILAYLMGAI